MKMRGSLGKVLELTILGLVGQTLLAHSSVAMPRIVRDQGSLSRGDRRLLAEGALLPVLRLRGGAGGTVQLTAKARPPKQEKPESAPVGPKSFARRDLLIQIQVGVMHEAADYRKFE